MFIDDYNIKDLHTNNNKAQDGKASATAAGSATMCAAPRSVRVECVCTNVLAGKCKKRASTGGAVARVARV